MRLKVCERRLTHYLGSITGRLGRTRPGGRARREGQEVSCGEPEARSNVLHRKGVILEECATREKRT